MLSTTRIHVRPNLSVLIDLADAEEVDNYRWRADKKKNGKLYVEASVRDRKDGKNHRILLSRLIAQPLRSEVVIHKNDDLLDFRRENLLKVDQLYVVRHAHAKRIGSSSYKGVSFEKRKWYTNRWSARIRMQGDQRIHLGHFATEKEAAQAYDAAALRYFGKAARLNFPDEVSKGS